MAGPSKLIIVMKGYPRLSETFIAQELLGLQKLGLTFDIWALRKPTDDKVHALHEAISAPVFYLPEYLHRGIWRVFKAYLHWRRHPHFKTLWAVFRRDFARDRSIDRVRRLGQALVLAREADCNGTLFYVHFLHTPASVTRYAALLVDRPWCFSAHAKDIWTTQDWEKSEKIADAAFGVTCTAFGARHLQALASDTGKVDLVYHGLDLSRFPPPPARSMSRVNDKIHIVSVGRLVEKKGYALLLEALAGLPAHHDWTFTHIGGGALSDDLRKMAQSHGIGARITWLGAQSQDRVVDLLREGDVFVLPSRIAKDGDRDGLPNVLMEAASQKCPIVSTKVAAITEFISDETFGYLAEADNVASLAHQLSAALSEPEERTQKAERLYARLTSSFTFDAGLRHLAKRLHDAMDDRHGL
ncbi:MAG: glycosyltransferase family 4 protein [Pseudomonadota bacterium]